MATAGYNTIIKRTGTPTSFSGESMSATSETNQYQIDDTTKRIWNREVEPTFYEDGSQISSSDIENINYLFGKVTFASSKSGAITVDGSYLPAQKIAGAQSYDLTQEINLEENTSYEKAQSNGGFRTRAGTLYDVSVSVTRFDDLSDYFRSAWHNQEEIICEIEPGGPDINFGIFRAFTMIETDNKSGDVESLEEEDISLMLNDDGNGTGFGWSDL